MKISFALILFLFIQFSFAQNLIPNPSFEDTVSCPIAPNQVNRAVGWHSSRNTPDYFNECDWINGLSSVPGNWAGYQFAHSGVAYCGAICYSRNDSTYRENFTCQLISPLTIGTKYLISFYVSHADNNYRLACNKLGVLLSTVNFDTLNNSPTNNYAQFFTDSIITDTTNWTYVSGTILADSNYSYFTIGNFFENYLVDTTYLFPAYADIYYYIDDITLMEDTATSVSHLTDDKPINIYPNPVNQKLKINLKNTAFTGAEMFNMDGKLVLAFDGIEYKKEYEIDLSKLTQGIYYLKLNFKNKNSTYHKLLKQ